jgi:hypothetical protein
VLSVLGQLAWPGVGGKLLVIAVMLSTVATLETASFAPVPRSWWPANLASHVAAGTRVAVMDVRDSPVISPFTRTLRRVYSTASERATSPPLGP